MPKIIGNTTATPNPKPDWIQTDETKADYIKNKPEIIEELDINGIFGSNQLYSASAVNDISKLINQNMVNVDITLDDKIDKNNILQEFDNETSHDDYDVYGANAINGLVESLDMFHEKIENKTTTIDDTSTDEEYPSAKAVYDALNLQNNILQEFDNETSYDNYAIYNANTINELSKTLDSLHEKIENKTTIIDDMSTDEEYPSAKAVYDMINGRIEELEIRLSSDLDFAYNLLGGAD